MLRRKRTPAPSTTGSGVMIWVTGRDDWVIAPSLPARYHARLGGAFRQGPARVLFPRQAFAGRPKTLLSSEPHGLGWKHGPIRPVSLRLLHPHRVGRVITIAIVSYRYGHLIAQAIESVLSQTQLPSHVVIVDDGARDVAPVAQKYLDDFRRRHIGVVLIDREKNLGIVENFNDVLMNAVRTPRVMFLGADNYLRPDALERLSALKEDIVSYDIALFGADSAAFAAEMKTTEVRDGYPIWRFVKGDITRANYIHGSSLYNATLAKRYGYRASGHWYTEEDWMLFRAMLEGGATHAHVAEP